MAAEFGVNGTGAAQAPDWFFESDYSERRIGNLDVVVRDAFVAVFFDQNRFVVRPDAVTQIIEQLDDRHGLLG